MDVNNFDDRGQHDSFTKRSSGSKGPHGEIKMRAEQSMALTKSLISLHDQGLGSSPPIVLPFSRVPVPLRWNFMHSGLLASETENVPSHDTESFSVESSGESKRDNPRQHWVARKDMSSSLEGHRECRYR